MERFVYKGARLKEISFPLGGIGTGCIGLAGNGRLVDWEIFNKPNKGSVNGFSHFALKAEANGKVLDSRVLNGDLPGPYTDKHGSGPPRTTMAGAPHFEKVEFQGEFPICRIRFHDTRFPGAVEMMAFNPFIPLNDRDSSIPAAFFEIAIQNTGEQPITYTACLSVNNPLPYGNTINSYAQEDGIHLIRLASNAFKGDEPEYGDLTVATDGDDVSYQEYWYRGRWFDNLGIFWRDFTSVGKLKNRTYPEEKGQKPNVSRPGNDMCSLAVHLKALPGETKKARFLLSWSFPNCYNYWSPEECSCGSGCCTTNKPDTWKNYYATIFENSCASAMYGLKNWERLFRDTLTFKEALFSSTVPLAALDAISANISILKTPTCLRLEDGSFYGWEGCNCDSGCCEGSCTHVWNYAYALPFLFPKLERSMRDLDFHYNQREDGGMSFRLQLPLGRERSSFRPCADGQFGGVLKAYRDWKISGDTQWLQSNWEAIKKSIDFAWAKTNEDRWDAGKEGVLMGRQHHTLDMELFGPNSWLTGFYLAALKAGAEMAEYLGDVEKACEYGDLFEKGSRWVDTHLFNGEYFHQRIDLKDRSILETFQEGDSLIGFSTMESYWNEESGEIKYQIGEGCGVDQVVAQWHANLCGLGQIFDKNKTRKALQSIYKYNFKKGMRDFFNPCRLYSLNDEAGVVICEWPEGKYKPMVPVPYAEETMNGFEYQVAAHMIQEGMMQEGTEIVEAIRDRYDGERRNPWNEFECGSNYARSMASYALLMAYSGFTYDMVEGMMGFDPVDWKGGDCRFFWSLECGWGMFYKEGNDVLLKVLKGKLRINRLALPFLRENGNVTVFVKGSQVDFRWQKGSIIFTEPAVLEEMDCIKVKIS